MPRFAHKSTDGLSPTAQRILTAGFLGKKTAAVIAREITEATGEEVAERTVSRRAAEWRADQRAMEENRKWAQALLKAAKEEDTKASEIIAALATDALMRNPDAFQSADPIKVQAANLEAEKLRQKARELELKERLFEMERQKIERLEEKVNAIKERAARLKQAAEKLSPEELDKEILAIYGLAAAN